LKFVSASRCLGDEGQELWLQPQWKVASRLAARRGESATRKYCRAVRARWGKLAPVHSSPGSFVSAKYGRYEPRPSGCCWRPRDRNRRPMILSTRSFQESVGLRLLGERSRANKQTSIVLYPGRSRGSHNLKPSHPVTRRQNRPHQPRLRAAMRVSISYFAA